MNLPELFDSFSRRNASTHKDPGELFIEFRTRVLLRCQDTFGGPPSGLRGPQDDFWSETWHKLMLYYGRTRLSNRYVNSPRDDITAFLKECPVDEFLDFVEFIFKSDFTSKLPGGGQHLVEEINQLLRLGDLPFHLTSFVKEKSSTKGFFGRKATIDETIEFPRIIPRESELLHQTAVEPTLFLLRDPAFKSANEEFLSALAHYRNEEYADSLTKCNNAFESVMKIICHKKGWTYQQNETAEKLLNHIVPRTTLGKFYKQPLMLIATIRNHLSSAHGAGVQTLGVRRHEALYAINATASAILLLVEETQPLGN